MSLTSEVLFFQKHCVADYWKYIWGRRAIWS